MSFMTRVQVGIFKVKNEIEENIDREPDIVNIKSVGFLHIALFQNAMHGSKGGYNP